MTHYRIVGQLWGGGPANGHVIPIPKGARYGGVGDGHLCVILPDARVYDLYDVGREGSLPNMGLTEGSPGEVVCGYAGFGTFGGSGLNMGATAAGYGLLAGLIRAPELECGRIDHALFFVVKNSNGRSIYPSAGGAGSGSGDPNLPPMGALFQLLYSDDEIEALPEPRWKKTILHAWAEYGAYFGDTGGPGMACMFESEATYTSIGLPNEMWAWAKKQEGQKDVIPYNGNLVFNIRPGIDWSRMRVLATAP